MTARSTWGAALAASALLLSGCTLTGTVVISSPQDVVVDLTYTPERPADQVRGGVGGCLLDSSTGTLEFRRQRNPGGTTVCRITGRASLADLQRYYGLARHVGNQVQVEFFPGGRVPDSVAAYQAGLFTHLDVSVTFPGSVIDHLGGTLTGSTVRFDDESEFVAHRGLAASGWDSVDVEARAWRDWLVLAASIGGAGVVGFVAGGWNGRRRRKALAAVHRRTLSEVRRLRAASGEAPPARGTAGGDPWSHE